MILVTGSEGLIGKVLVRYLKEAGIGVREFDTRGVQSEDICDPSALNRAMLGVTGVVHLAAVSRVVWAQNDPDLCKRTNVDAINSIASLCLANPAKPWIISASSREVYGQASTFPVQENSVLKPMNTYAHSKVAGEDIINRARDVGLVANICRFSNVYGSADDHADRVVNAFARTAVTGGEIRLEGPSNTFDFTFVDEVARGLFHLVQATMDGESLPPIHFVSGTPTTLLDLSKITLAHAKMPVTLRSTEPRSFDVSSFVGDPTRAHRLLGWRSSMEIDQGFQILMDRHRVAALSPPHALENDLAASG